MKTTSIIPIYLWMLAVCGLAGADIEQEFNAIQPGSRDEAALNRSLAIPVPHDDFLSMEAIGELSKQAGDIERYPDANVITLISLDRTGFDTSAYSHSFIQEAYKILTDKGVETMSSVPISYSMPYNRVRIIESFMISPDGRITRVTPGMITDVSDSSDVDSNIYEPIWRKKVISFPGIQVGSVLCYSAELVSLDPVQKGKLDWGHTFRTTEPVYRASCCLSRPKDCPFYWHVQNDPDRSVVFSETTTEETVRSCWESHDLPMIIEEPGMIPLEELRTTLLVSTKTWKEYSAMESPEIEKNLVPDEAITNKVHELTAGVTRPAERLEILFQYVTKKVRYMGVSYGDRPGVNPDPVTRTFANNAGVCKDKAGLLTSMLRLAGIEAYYTLNNPERRLDTTVAVDQFNHAIVSARLEGEDAFRYLDVTVDLEKSMIPASSGGTAVLRITPEGSDIDTIFVKPPDQNLGILTADSSIDEEGRLSSFVRYESIGDADTMLRSPFYYIPPAQHNEWFQYLLESLGPSVDLERLTVRPQPLDDLTQPFYFEVDFKVPKYMTRASRFGLIKLPQSLGIFDSKLQYVREIASLANRRYPVDLVGTYSIRVKETLRYPDRFKVKTLPEPVHINSGGILFDQDHRVEDRTIVLDQTLTILEPRILPGQYPDFLRTLEQIANAAKAYVIFDLPERGGR